MKIELTNKVYLLVKAHISISMQFLSYAIGGSRTTGRETLCWSVLAQQPQRALKPWPLSTQSARIHKKQFMSESVTVAYRRFNCERFGQ